MELPASAGDTGIVVYLLIHVGLAIRVIMQRHPPGVSAAWLLSLILMPYLGPVLYLLIGERALGRRRAERARAMQGAVKTWFSLLAQRSAVAESEIAERWRPISDLAEGAAGSAALGANRVGLLEEAERILRAIVADIAAAEHSCFLEFYIWNPGGVADEVAEELIRAAARGVCCRVLLDAVGSAEFFDSHWPARFRAAGIQLREALPAGIVRAMFRRIDLRLHRKLVIIDGRLAYTGSLNLVDPRFFKQDAGVGFWVDAMVRVEGPVADALAGLFGWDWALETGEPYAASHGDRPGPADHPAQGVVVQTVPSGPGYEGSGIVQLLLSAVYGARRELTLTTPYFVPDEALVGALRAAAQRGVRVRLIVPARVDSFLVRQASRAFYDDLLKSGVEIMLFQGGLLHTKSVVVDRELAFFGTLNMDLRSFLLNLEVTLIVYGASFAEPLAQLQDRYLERSTPVDPIAWSRRPAMRRLLENVIQLASPLL